MTCNCSKPLAQMPTMKPNRQKVDGHQQQEQQHQQRVLDADVDEQIGGGEDDQGDDHRLGRRRADVAEHRLERRQRRRQDLVDRAGEARHVDAEAGVEDALGEQRQHHQPGDDEAAVVDAVDLAHAAADRGAEHDEIERGGDHRHGEPGPQRPPEAVHLELVDRPDPAPVHAADPARPAARGSGRRKCPRGSIAWCRGP